MPKPQMENQRLTKVSQNVDTFAAIPERKVPQSRVSQVLNVLNNSLPGVAREATNEMNRLIQEDETRQTSRALVGMTPTEDATVAGAQAHKDVNTRNAVSARMRELAQEATQWETEVNGSWEDYLVQEQDALVQLHGETQNDIEMVGGLFRDMLPGVHDVRFKTEQQQDQVRKYRTTMDSFTVAVDPTQYSTDEMAANVAQIFNESGAMGMTQEAVRKSFVDAAAGKAEQNDLTLINLAKDIGIYAQEPGLIQAERSAKNRLAAEQASGVASAILAVENEMALSEGMSDEEAIVKLGGIQTLEGKPVLSYNEILSRLEKSKKKKDSKFQADEYFRKGLARLSDENAEPVSFDHLDKKQQQTVVDMFDDWNTQQAGNAIAGAGDDQATIDQIEADSVKRKASFLAENGLIDGRMAADFSAVALYNPETHEGEKLPPKVADSLSNILNMSDSNPMVLAKHADPKTVALAKLWKLHTDQGDTVIQALSAARKTVDAGRPRLVGEPRKGMVSGIQRNVVAQFEHSWPMQLAGISGSDVRDTQKANMVSQVTGRADELYQLTGNIELSVDIATKEFNDNHFQLKNGVVMQGSLTQVANRMNIQPDSVSRAFDDFPELIVAKMEEGGTAPNTSFPPEDWVPEVSADGLVRYKDPRGITIGIFSSTEVAGLSNKKVNDKIQLEKDTLRERREAYFSWEATQGTASKDTSSFSDMSKRDF